MVASMFPGRPVEISNPPSGLTSELDPKRLELLHTANPTASPIGVLVNPNRPGLYSQLQELQAAADKMNLKLEIQKAATEQEIDDAFRAFSSQRVGALLVTADPFFNNRRAQVRASFLRAPNQLISPSYSRRHFFWLSTFGRPGHSGSLFLPRSLPALMR
jgi:hypothetical protein